MEGLKPFKEMFSFDDRQWFFVGNPREIHRQIEAIELDEDVPDEVRETFDLARNLGVYSMAVYNFNRLTPLIGFIALEKALKNVAKDRAPDLFRGNRQPMFSKLINRALNEGWITEEGIGDREGIARARVLDKKLAESATRMKRDGTDKDEVEDPTQDEIRKEMTEMEVIKQICSSAKELRNGMAHGELPLQPNSWTLLHRTADLINQLYRI